MDCQDASVVTMSSADSFITVCQYTRLMNRQLHLILNKREEKATKAYYFTEKPVIYLKAYG